MFYYLLAGSDPKLRKELQLDKAQSEMNDFIPGFDPQVSIILYLNSLELVWLVLGSDVVNIRDE